MSVSLLSYRQIASPTLTLFIVIFLVFDFLNLEVSGESTKRPKYSNSKKHNNTEIKEKANMVERPEDAAKVIQVFKEIIRSNKKKETFCS